MTTCTHLDTARPAVEPDSPDGCADCLREGSTWLHLRECLDCGHVACCDSSPRKHATGHYNATAHPVIRSFEPGEEWRWCYPDELFVEGPAAASPP